MAETYGPTTTVAGSAAGKMRAAGKINPERFHYCPECPADEKGVLQRMQATKIMPGGKMVYNCKNGHSVDSRMTILK